jgi:AcrR family transcriptional regulator
VRHDLAALERRAAQPVEKPLPVGGCEQHDREVADLARLAQRRGLEQLVERAEAARERDERARVAHEHHLAREEVVEGQGQVDVRVHRLLVRQLDVEADRGDAGVLCPAVGSLHDPGPAAGDDREARLAEPARDLARERVLGVVGRGPRGAEDRDRLADVRQRREAVPELLGDALEPSLVGEVALDVERLGLEQLLVERLGAAQIAIGVGVHRDRVGPPRPGAAALGLTQFGGMAEPAYTRLDVEERRRRLLELGADLFARFSYDELSMAAIAREAGISKALLYHYFPGKQAYFTATLEQGVAELASRVDPAAPPAEQLDAFLAWVEERGDAYAKLVRSAGSVPDVREVIEVVRSATVQRILAGLPGEATPQRRTAVRAWLWFMDGAILDWLEHRDVNRAELRALLLRTLEGALGERL